MTPTSPMAPHCTARPAGRGQTRLDGQQGQAEGPVEDEATVRRAHLGGRRAGASRRCAPYWSWQSHSWSGRRCHARSSPRRRPQSSPGRGTPPGSPCGSHISPPLVPQDTCRPSLACLKKRWRAVPGSVEGLPQLSPGPQLCPRKLRWGRTGGGGRAPGKRTCAGDSFRGSGQVGAGDLGGEETTPCACAGPAELGGRRAGQQWAWVPHLSKFMVPLYLGLLTSWKDSGVWFSSMASLRTWG